MTTTVSADFSKILSRLKAVADPTRLRLLALCAAAELTVSELVAILGQSQPRVSRHLRILCEAGLLARAREGSWAFYRGIEDGPEAELRRAVVGLVSPDDRAIARDRARLRAVQRERADQAAAYFRANAQRWNEIRALYVDEAEVEAALLAAAGDGPFDAVLDVGTGTGRILQLFGPRARRGLGVDISREMLNIARGNLARADLAHCQARLGDMYDLPLPDASFDLVTLHQVLHFADRPAAAIAEATRVLRPGGQVLIADFAPHRRDELRTAHAHRRLGFGDEEVAGWLRAAGLQPAATRSLGGRPLTVVIWSARRSAADAAGASDAAARSAA
jgi:SAM-dependent methyltransferase/DNA-binding transcriptional ArsR family regulator